MFSFCLTAADLKRIFALQMKLFPVKSQQQELLKEKRDCRHGTLDTAHGTRDMGQWRGGESRVYLDAAPAVATIDEIKRYK